MTDTPAPIVVNPSPATSAATLAVRQATLVMGGATAALAFARHHDLDGFVAWAQTDAAAPFIAGVGVAATIVWGQVRQWGERLKLILAARSHANTTVVVKGDAPIPPTPAR